MIDSISHPATSQSNVNAKNAVALRNQKDGRESSTVTALRAIWLMRFVKPRAIANGVPGLRIAVQAGAK